MPWTTLITTSQLSRLVGLSHAPALVDVRTDEDYRADPRNDLQQLEAAMALYDAFYRWCRDTTSETHNWPSQKPSS